jgi:hypothetical protein
VRLPCVGILICTMSRQKLKILIRTLGQLSTRARVAVIAVVILCIVYGYGHKISSQKTEEIQDFDDVTLSEVIHQFEATYNVTILMENKDMGNCRIMITETAPTLQKNLDMISKALDFTYEIDGNTVILHGDGCK